jgi:hypothetical protein
MVAPGADEGRAPWVAAGLAALLGALTFLNPLVAAVALGVLMLALVVFRWPVVGVWLILGCVYLFNLGFRYNNPVKIVDEFTPIVVIPIVFLTMLLLMKHFGGHDRVAAAREGRITYEWFPRIFFWVFALISLSWSLDPKHGFQDVYLIAAFYMILWSVPRALDTPRKIDVLLHAYPFVAIPLGIMLLLSKEYFDFIVQEPIYGSLNLVFLLHTIGDGTKLRLGGYAPVNIAANVINGFLFVNLYIAYRSGKFVRAMLGVHSLFLLYCLLKTGSKAGIVSLALGGMFLLVAVPEFRARVLRITGIGVMLGSLVLVVAGQLIIKRFSGMFSGKDSFVYDRLIWWSEGMRNWLDTYGRGLGAGGFPILIDPVPAAHSFYLSAFFEYGVIGFGAFILFLGLLLLKVYRMMPSVKRPDMRFAVYCLGATLVSILSHGLLDFEYAFMPLWFAFAILLSIGRVSERQSAA